MHREQRDANDLANFEHIRGSFSAFPTKMNDQRLACHSSARIHVTIERRNSTLVDGTRSFNKRWTGLLTG